MMSLRKNPQPPTKKFFFQVQTTRLAEFFLAFDSVCSAYRTREIPTQSHVQSGCFCANRLT